MSGALNWIAPSNPARAPTTRNTAATRKWILASESAAVLGSLLTSVEASGEVRLSGARIAGDLDCGHMKVRSATGLSIEAESAVIEGNVILSKATLEGEVYLSGSRMKGLECHAARFGGRGKKAFSADYCVLQFGAQFTKGSSRLVSARIRSGRPRSP